MDGTVRGNIGSFREEAGTHSASNRIRLLKSEGRFLPKSFLTSFSIRPRQPSSWLRLDDVSSKSLLIFASKRSRESTKLSRSSLRWARRDWRCLTVGERKRSLLVSNVCFASF